MRWLVTWRAAGSCTVLLGLAAPTALGGGRPEHIPAGEVEHRAVMSHRGAELSVALPDRRGQELLEAVESGLSSRVTFEVRLYRRRIGLMGIFGDQAIGEVTVSHGGSFAPLTGEYLLEVTRRHRSRDAPVAQLTVVARYDNRESFRQALLSLADELVWRPSGDTAGSRHREAAYLAFRVQVEPVELAAPLHIISMFGRGSHATGWIHLPLPPAREMH